jgi:hypothetical protein
MYEKGNAEFKNEDISAVILGLSCLVSVVSLDARSIDADYMNVVSQIEREKVYRNNMPSSSLNSEK